MTDIKSNGFVFVGGCNSYIPDKLLSLNVPADIVMALPTGPLVVASVNGKTTKVIQCMTVIGAITTAMRMVECLGNIVDHICVHNEVLIEEVLDEIVKNCSATTAIVNRSM